jgi:hypothetical protein
MAKISYELLFFIVCVGVGVYINRKNFNGFVYTVFGIPMPKYVISAGVSIFIGILLFIIIHILLLNFRK